MDFIKDLLDHSHKAGERLGSNNKWRFNCVIKILSLGSWENTAKNELYKLNLFSAKMRFNFIFSTLFRLHLWKVSLFRLSVLESVHVFVCVCAGGESHLVVLQRSRVERPTQEELSYHTSQRPHVYGLTKWQAQNNLWSPAERKEKEKVTPGSCSPSIITNRSYWHNPENNKISMDWQEWKGWDRCSFCWMELKRGWTGMFMRTKR